MKASGFLFAVTALTLVACSKRLVRVDTAEQAVVAAEAFLLAMHGKEEVRKRQPHSAMWGREADHWLVWGREYSLVLVAKNGHVSEFVAAAGDTFTIPPSTPKK